MARYFEKMLSEKAGAKNSVTWLTVELQGRLKGQTLENSPVDAVKLALLVKRIEDGTSVEKLQKRC
jgi:aspartyl-tRNA(Asn)/glutamyl-tRNA(Gln) amidotransferase subunit B